MFTNKQLSLIILIGAPFLLIGTQLEAVYPHLVNSRWTGLWGFLFLSSWLAGLEYLRRTRATGIQCHGLCALWTTMVLLTLANVSNLWQMIAPGTELPLFEVLDMGWPLSYLMMPVIGILVLHEKKETRFSFNSWHRFTPLIMGIWYPFTLVAGQSEDIHWVVGVFSALAWSLPALAMTNLPVSFSFRRAGSRWFPAERQISQSF